MQEDVYETNDLPESDQDRTKEETFDSEHVEKTNVDVNAAYQAFKGKGLDSEGLDFSDTVGKRRRGYGAGAYVIELVKPISGEPETAIQQYNRLQHEIRELSEKLHDVKQVMTTEKAAERLLDNVTASDVAELQQNLKQLQVEQILGQQATNDLADPHTAVLNKVVEAMEKLKQQSKPQQTKGKSDSLAAPSAVTYELYCHADRSQTADLTKFAEVESRLAALEQILGSDNEKLAALTTDTKGKTITDAIESLAQRLQMLDLNHLELVEARLTVLSQKLSQIKEKKTALDGEDASKVNEVYEMMKKWDGLCSSLPQIVNRMQSLKELHEQCLQFSQSLTFLDGIQQELSKSLESDVSLLNEMKETFAKNLDAFKSNCDNIDKRLKSLSK